jgi:hypothetical protein
MEIHQPISSSRRRPGPGFLAAWMEISLAPAFAGVTVFGVVRLKQIDQ